MKSLGPSQQSPCPCNIHALPAVHLIEMGNRQQL
jgi:hypothetical protein